MQEYRVQVYDDRTECRNLEGQLHRTDGLPAIVYSDSSRGYFVDGKLHRTDGPAIEWLSHKAYYVDGKKISFLKFHLSKMLGLF